MGNDLNYLKNLKELKEFVNTLTDEQLEQKITIGVEDGDNMEIKSCWISEHDFYIDKEFPDRGGTFEQLKITENDLEFYDKQPAGTILFFTTDNPF